MTEILDDKIVNKSILIFDLDGTIIDTDEANFLAYQEAIKKVKSFTLLNKDTERFTQEKLKSSIPYLKTQEYNKIIDIKNDVYENYLHETKAITFALEIIKKYFQTHRMILATNSHELRANLVLDYHGLLTMFEYKFYKENYKNKKISKYSYVLKSLNLRPKEVIIFENDELEKSKAIILGIPINNIIDLSTKNIKERL